MHNITNVGFNFHGEIMKSSIGLCCSSQPSVSVHNPNLGFNHSFYRAWPYPKIRIILLLSVKARLSVVSKQVSEIEAPVCKMKRTATCSEFILGLICRTFASCTVNYPPLGGIAADEVDKYKFSVFFRRHTSSFQSKNNWNITYFSEVLLQKIKISNFVFLPTSTMLTRSLSKW